SVSTRDLHEKYCRGEQWKGLQEIAKRPLEPARHSGQLWSRLARRGGISIADLQARGMSAEQNLNEAEDDAQGQDLQLDTHKVREKKAQNKRAREVAVKLRWCSLLRAGARKRVADRSRRHSLGYSRTTAASLSSRQYS